MSYIPVKRIGHYLAVDDHGFVIPDVCMHKIHSDWLAIIENIQQELIEKNTVNGVYIRGSVPRGLVQNQEFRISLWAVRKPIKGR